MTNALYDGVANRCTAQRSPAYCMNVFTNMDQMNMHEDTAYSDYRTARNFGGLKFWRIWQIGL